MEMAKKARDVMTGGTECIGENDTLVQAAQKLAHFAVDGMPICGEDNRLKGFITSHGIVTRAIALGKDPHQTRVKEFTYGKPVTIGADDTIEDALKTMTDHNVRWLPVIDGHDLVGVIHMTDGVDDIPAPRSSLVGPS
jgi:CBS domain-containing protein